MQFGGHVSSAGGIDTAIDRVEAIGGDCVQVFTQSPRMWRPTNHKPESIERFKSRRAEAGIGGVVCHALYLCNLAAPDDEIYEKSIVALGATVDAAVSIEADAVIFHVGSHLGAGFEAGLERVVPALEQILPRCVGPTYLLMENSAGTGGTIGRSLEELVALMNGLDKHPRLGICLDSCHLYASGYDVTKPEVVDQLVAQIDGEMGIDRLRALHINDSAMPFASNRDRHANILEGELGEGLGAFLAHPAFQELSAYLEVEGAGQGPDANELRKVRELHARWTTPPPTKQRLRPGK
ncbi:MAG TPA: deoxyribonuclease IV [Gaiellaceae bacterium]|nr:deoxyribonuclease IV [Gaiellaceae bacterium]